MFTLSILDSVRIYGETVRQGSIYKHGILSKQYVSFTDCNVVFEARTACSEGEKELLIHHTAIFRFLMCWIHAISVAFYESVSSIDKKTNWASRLISYHIKVEQIFNSKSATLLWIFVNARNRQFKVDKFMRLVSTRKWNPWCPYCLWCV